MRIVTFRMHEEHIELLGLRLGLLQAYDISGLLGEPVEKASLLNGSDPVYIPRNELHEFKFPNFLALSRCPDLA